MNVLITGMQNPVKESIVKIALERLGAKAKYRVLSFSDFVDESHGTVTEIKMLRDIQARLTKKVQVSLLQSKSGEHSIINGYSTAKTKIGYMPIITKASLDVFKPDLVAFIHMPPESLGDKLKDRAEFEQHQSVEREFALMFGAWAGAAVRIVHTGPEGSRKGSEELYKLLKTVLVV